MSLELVLITGMSGSGKSVSLRALEDAGYYCVDNLPPELLLPFIDIEQQNRAERVAIAIDVRSATSLPQVAACADHHLVVSKASDRNGPSSTVQPVQGEQRVGEVARMLGGEKLSGTTLAHAKEMLSTAAVGAAKP